MWTEVKASKFWRQFLQVKCTCGRGTQLRLSVVNIPGGWENERPVPEGGPGQGNPLSTTVLL